MEETAPPREQESDTEQTTVSQTEVDGDCIDGVIQLSVNNQVDRKMVSRWKYVLYFM